MIREAEEVARDQFGLSEPRAAALPGGRVNETFKVSAGGGLYILQRLNRFFQDDEALGLNWRRLVLIMSERSAPPLVPSIFPDLAGRFLAVRPGWGGAWRLTEFRAGRPVARDEVGARAAARALGRLHRFLNRPAPVQLLSLPEGEFTNQRLAPAAELESFPSRYRGHPHLPALLPIWEKMAGAARDLPLRPSFLNVFRLREVVVHSDPKADNFLWDGRGEVQAVLDWDTAGLGHMLVDVGEMLRSFGAAAGNEADLAAAAAVVEGYAETGLDLTEADLELLPSVWRALALNLSRRYLTDALAEIYFLWDRQNYPSLYEQNRRRGETILEAVDRLFHKEMELIDLFQLAARRGRARRASAP